MSRARRRSRLSLAQRLLRSFINWKYATMAYWLRLPQVHSRGEGAILIRIDALGFQHLGMALRLGLMPHLKKLLASGEYRVQRWRCGLPSDTTPVECGLLYGHSNLTPGFYWLEKASGRRFNSAHPIQVRELEGRLAAQGNPGLLSGGSTYATILTGGSQRAVLTVSALGERLFRSIGFVELFLYVLLSPLKVLAGIRDAIGEIISEFSDRCLVVLKALPRIREGIFPLTRITINVFFREVALVGTLIDIFRGVPVIYASFSAYDLVAHRSGPTSPNALRTLRAVDRCLRLIDRNRRWCRRPYGGLYVFSDHGMSPSIPLCDAYGSSLCEVVRAAVGEGTPVEEYDAQRYYGAEQLSPLNQDLEAFERHGVRPVRWLVRLARRNLWRSLSAPQSQPGNRITIVDCSTFAHLYLREATERLELDAIEACHPGLAANLASHPGIGLVVALQGEEVVAMGKEGTAHLGRGCRVEGQNPLEQYEEPVVAASEIARFARSEGCGDLILFGAIQDGKVICFQRQYGGHGSIGGDQFYPFFIHPANKRLDLRDATNAEQLYPLLARLLRGARRAGDERGTVRPALPSAEEAALALGQGAAP